MSNWVRKRIPKALGTTLASIYPRPPWPQGWTIRDWQWIQVLNFFFHIFFSVIGFFVVTFFSFFSVKCKNVQVFVLCKWKRVLKVIISWLTFVFSIFDHKIKISQVIGITSFLLRATNIFYCFLLLFCDPNHVFMI